MLPLVRRLDWSALTPHDAEDLLTREWLVTNGLGGYASGTVAGARGGGGHDSCAQQRGSGAPWNMLPGIFAVRGG